MRVIILTYIFTDNDPRYGGEGRVVWETSNALARQGVEVFVITSMKNLKTAPHPNIRLYQIPFAKKNFLNFNPGELLKMFFFCIPLIYIKQIDIIHHLPTSGPDLFARFKFGRIFAESADPPQDYENPKFGHELKLDNANKMKEAGLKVSRWQAYDFWSRVARRLCTWAGVNEKYPKGTDVFFYRALGFRNALKKMCPNSELFHVPNGVDTAAFSPRIKPHFPKIQTGGLRFLHVGSINRRKGTRYLVEAFIQSLSKHPENELFLVGRGEAGYISELKAMAAAHPQISFHENVSHEDLPGAYTSADVFCLVPLSGSTPTVLGEALASGLPVIGTTQSGSGEAIEHYNVGLLVEPGEVQELADAITKMTEDRKLLADKRSLALKASEFFSWDYIARELVKGYEHTLRVKGKQAP